MGLYDRYVVPRMNDMMASGPDADRCRKQVLAPARGRVLDVGFGTGLNAAHYPAEVERVIGLEPNPGAEAIARKRIAAVSVQIDLLRGSAERIAFEDASFDTVVTTLVLCTVPNPDVALREIRRVLVPGGRYLFLEHGLSPDASLQKWQHRLNGVQKLMAGGCNLDRPILRLVESAGFHVEALEEFYFPKAPRYAGFTTLASATVG